jgi:hypothetical protein
MPSVYLYIPNIIGMPLDGYLFIYNRQTQLIMEKSPNYSPQV